MKQPSLEFDVSLQRARFSLSLKGQTRPGVTAIFGTSGCGKTTFLRCIAGLEPRCQGRIRLGEDIWLNGQQTQPPHRRNVGFVFQDARLFAHLTVAGNLAYARRRRRQEGPSITEVVSILGIEHLQQQLPSALSGGEAQRVALARALMAGPSLLLLDEPLAALDYGRRRRIMPLISAIPERFGISVLYVTHARQEVLEMADHLMLLEQGQCVLHDRVDAAFSDPEYWPKLGDLSPMVIWEGRVVAYDPAYRMHQVATPGGMLDVPGEPMPKGQSVRLRIRSSDVVLLENAQALESQDNVLPVVVMAMQPSAEGRLLVQVKTAAGGQLWADLGLRAAEQFGLHKGFQLQAMIRPGTMRRYPAVQHYLEG